MDKFDLLVLGTGPAASRVAMRCAEGGWSVGVVDPRPFGGTCALRGCNPKKVLVRAAELCDWSRRMVGKGVRSGDAQIEWSELVRFTHTFTEPVTESKENSLQKAGIRQFHGSPRFTGRNAVEINGQKVESPHFLIATGAVPMELPIEGREHLTTIKSGDWAKFNSMRKVGETHAAYKILVENGSDRLLGAHLLGHDAAESINIFALAMRFQLKASEVKSVLFTFPTFAADICPML